MRLGIAQSPEGRRIFPRMSVLENLELGAFARADHDGIASDLERVFTLFPRLRERITQKGGTLSGGEQQMLAIGRALMARPAPAPARRAVHGAVADPGRDDLPHRPGHQRPGHDDPAGRAERPHGARVAHRGYVIQTGRIVLQDFAAELLRSDIVRKTYLGEK